MTLLDNAAVVSRMNVLLETVRASIPPISLTESSDDVARHCRWPIACAVMTDSGSTLSFDQSDQAFEIDGFGPVTAKTVRLVREARPSGSGMLSAVSLLQSAC